MSAFLMWHHETKWAHYKAFLKLRLKPFWLLRRCIFHQYYLHHLCHSSTYRGCLRRFWRLLFGKTNHSMALTLMLLSLKIFVGRHEFQFFSFSALFLQRHCRRRQRPDRRRKSHSHSRGSTKVAERDLNKTSKDQFHALHDDCVLSTWQYSNHLNTGLVQYSNGRFVSSCQMVRYPNGGLKTGLYKAW